MNFDIKETPGEDERGAYTEVSANVGRGNIGIKVYHSDNPDSDRSKVAGVRNAIALQIMAQSLYDSSPVDDFMTSVGGPNWRSKLGEGQ